MTAPIPQSPKLKIAVGIASAGRPATLLETVTYIDSLQPQPERIIVCVPNLDDAGGLGGRENVELMVGPRGLTCQRNRIIEAASANIDVLIFLDDDFIPAPGFIPRMTAVFADNPDVVIATGDVLADGILGEGLTQSEAIRIITTAGERGAQVTEVYNAYGCNMAVRMAPIISDGLAFDEELPLYGWLEDVDFSRSIARYGRSVRISGACGVHLGVKSGRQPGKRLGYSQVANPAHLMRKGTMSWTRALAQISRNILANIRGVLFNDRAVDRRGRLNGNFLALSDLLMGRASPMRILELSQPSNRDMSSSFIAVKRR
ncbi:GT2 family glycosyltransferase [Rhizobium sp. BK529]|uniref:glycosyltransferase family 2 protein n=1 Tax=unclassified Rhizobium TaxID=2613769 RepID=UPI0010500F65|nr:MULTISPECIES: glycosyltransferase [unclassified Rhizobium]MBB3589691.1 GT2 family glycosyltransferase [Rhizobium sp. BK529]TCS04360.1 GT2 family glycosyltransferase [Rhizobium sp. BK418]